MDKIQPTHTPGPWDMDEPTKDFFTIGPRRLVRGTDDVAQIRHGRNRRRAETLANARLIAAAPEMREALQFVVEAINRLRDMRSVELNNQGQLAEELDDMDGQARDLLARIDGR